jgi:hypothetical protein
VKARAPPKRGASRREKHGCLDSDDASLLQAQRQEVSNHPEQRAGVGGCTGSNIGQGSCVERPAFTAHSFGESAGDQRSLTVYVPPEAPKLVPSVPRVECNFVMTKVQQSGF